MRITSSPIKGAIIAAAGAAALWGLQPGTWRKIANEGEFFPLAAQQTVRFGAGQKWTQKVFAAGGPCTVTAFDNVDPAPGVAKQCDLKSGPPIPTDDGGPTTMNAGVQVADVSKWPALGTGFAATEILTGWAIPPTRTGYWEEGGEQRVTCNQAWTNFNDPIVYPGQPGVSHLHSGAGNTKLDAYTTPENIRSLAGAVSTCLGGAANLSAYWVPSMLDLVDSGGTKGIPLESGFLVYYKSGNWRYMGETGTTGCPDDPARPGGSFVDPACLTKNPPPVMTELPIGLRMIAGVASNTDAGRNPITFTCHFVGIDHDMLDPSTGAKYHGLALPNWCPHDAPNPDNPTGDPKHRLEIWQFVSFGQCWNGQLDSPNHRDHVRGHIGGAKGPDGRTDAARLYKCPDTHPYILVHITIIPMTPVPIGGAANVVLSSDVYAIGEDGKLIPGVLRGLSGHADWFNGWDPAVVTRWHQNCMTETTRRDCGTGGLGDGGQLREHNDNQHRFVNNP